MARFSPYKFDRHTKLKAGPPHFSWHIPVCKMDIQKLGAFSSVLLVSAIVTIRGNGQGRSPISDGMLHPTAENIAVVTDPRFVLRTNPEHRFIDRADYDTVAIGVNEGAHHEMFGSIADLAVDNNGSLFVLDSEYNEVRFFDYDGSLMGTFGAPGEGPGEFRNPRQLAVTDHGKTIFVIGGDRSIPVFERKDAATYTEKYTFKKGMRSSAGCAMNGHLYLLGYTPDIDGVIHKFTPEGKRIASFGAPYKSRNAFVVASQSGRGLLACSEEHRIVGLIRENIPVFTGYTEAGDVAWHVTFADFKSCSVVETIADDGAPTMQYHTTEPGQSVFEKVFTDSSGDLYVQYNTGVQSGRKPRHLFRIDALTGEGQYLGNAPRVRDIDSGHIFTLPLSRFPQVVVYGRK